MLIAMAKERVPEAVREYMAQIGSRGGKAKPAKPRGPAALSTERRIEIARNAAKARWGKKKS
jgi:hypothetical protein